MLLQIGRRRRLRADQLRRLYLSLTAACVRRQSVMAYDDDDDDLFDEEFDFVDEDEATTEPPEAETEGKSSAKSRKSTSGSSRGKSAPRSRGRGKSAASSGRREPPRDEEPEEAEEPAASEFGEGIIPDEEAAEPEPVEPPGPPADHVIHIYEYGKYKRTIPRKFTDEEAVNFAEEYTRTNKAYGRYAIATPEDEEPAEEFADAAKG